MAKTGMYALQGITPQKVADAAFDVKVIDAYNDNGVAWTPAQVQQMGGGAGGGLLLGYFSIGQAETYRDYFSSIPAAALGPQDPNWPGCYDVAYWTAEWKAVATNYITNMINAGFDGVIFDMVDEFQTAFAQKNAPGGNAAQAMADLVKYLNDFAASLNPNFQIWANGGEDLLTNQTYFNSIDGMFLESLYYIDGQKQPAADTQYRLNLVSKMVAAGKDVIDIEYVKTATQIADVSAKASANGLGWYVSNTELMGIGTGGASTGSTTTTATTTTSPTPTSQTTTVNSVTGGAGDDTLNGTSGADSMTGGGGDDLLRGGGGNDTINGGAGVDTVLYTDKTAAISVTLNGSNLATVSVGGVAEDKIKNIENVTGGAGNDNITGDGQANTLIGGAGNDSLSGGGGNDVLMGGAGRDTLNGGSGVDTADYSDKTASVSVTLNGSTNATVYVGGVAEDTVRNVENVTGGFGNDILTGDSLANTLVGGAGNDTLNGRSGNDTLTGGSGADTFVFNTTLSWTNVDLITDFAVGEDKVQLASSIFKTLPVGTLAGTAFYVGASAHDATDRIIYNGSTGALFYDADGSGSGAAVQFATLSAGLALTRNDFLIS